MRCELCGEKIELGFPVACLHCVTMAEWKEREKQKERIKTLEIRIAELECALELYCPDHPLVEE